MSLADELTLEPAATRGDEVVCPGVEGENLAARALARVPRGDGWGGAAAAARRSPSASRSRRDGRRLGRRRRGAAARRGRRRAADRALLRELAPRLGADVAALVRPGRVLMTGAGEHVTACPKPAPFGMLVVPLDAAL